MAHILFEDYPALCTKLKAKNCSWTVVDGVTDLISVTVGIQPNLKKPNRKVAEKIAQIIKEYIPKATCAISIDKILGVTLFVTIFKE